MDVLSDVLDGLELSGWLCSRTEIAPLWRFDFAASEDSTFHIINFGGGYMFIEGETLPLRVENGDVVVFPHGHAHSFCDTLASPVTASKHLEYHHRSSHEVAPLEGEDTITVLLCGVFHFEKKSAYPLLQSLPKFIHIPGEQGRATHGFTEIVQLIAQESVRQESGSEIMLRRLIEMLFIQIVRIWTKQQMPANSGCLAALRDPSIGAALGLIHQKPEHGWTVEELAHAVALSRSAFSARFTSLVGESPMKYLTRWRMHMASRWLKNEVKIESIAQRLGYDSEIAFRKAFKREIGIPPAQYRQRA